MDPLVNNDNTLGLSIPVASTSAVLLKLKTDPFLHRFCDYATILTHEFASFESLLEWDELVKPEVMIKLSVMPNNDKTRLIKELPSSVSLTQTEFRTHYLFATSEPRPRGKKQAFAKKEEIKYLASLTVADNSYPVYASERYTEDPHICRAYWKLAEVFTTHPSILATGGNAIDVGSSPGGWTECLLENGADRVIGIDPGAMDERLKAVVVEDINAELPADNEGGSKVTHLKMQAEKTVRLVNLKMPDGIDLMVCDANMSPETIHTMLRPLTKLVKVGGSMVLTLKLVNGAKSAKRCLREAADRFVGWNMIWGGHCMGNKGKERTVVFVKEAQFEETQEEQPASVEVEKEVKSGKFWEEYHKANPGVDWITTPKNIIEHLSGKNDKVILEVGCGTSELGKEMAVRWKDKEITATDVSPAAVSICSSRHEGVTNLKYEVLDLLGDVQGKGKWGVVVDKGCLDTFMFRSPVADRLEHVTRALDNIHTLLSPGGKYVVVSPRGNIQARFGGVGWRLKDWKGWESVVRKRVTCEVSLEGRTGVGDVYVYSCTRLDSYDPKAEGGKFKEQDEGPENCPACGIARGTRVGRAFRQWRNHVMHCVNVKDKERKKREREGGGEGGEKQGKLEGLAGKGNGKGLEGKKEAEGEVEGEGKGDGQGGDDIARFWKAWNKAHLEQCIRDKDGEGCSCFEGQGAIM